MNNEHYHRNHEQLAQLLSTMLDPTSDCRLAGNLGAQESYLVTLGDGRQILFSFDEWRKVGRLIVKARFPDCLEYDSRCRAAYPDGLKPRSTTGGFGFNGGEAIVIGLDYSRSPVDLVKAIKSRFMPIFADQHAAALKWIEEHDEKERRKAKFDGMVCGRATKFSVNTTGFSVTPECVSESEVSLRIKWLSHAQAEKLFDLLDSFVEQTQ